MRILVAVSFLKDDFPWIYELGMEVFRAINTGDRQGAQRSRSQLMNALRSLRHGPMSDFTSRRDVYDVVHFATMILEEDSRELELKVRPRKRPAIKSQPTGTQEPPKGPDADKDSADDEASDTD